MAITKETVIGSLEVVGDYKLVQVRTDTVIKEDGKELSRTYHRHVLHPNDNISGEDASVQSVCNAVWTQAVKDEYATFRAEEEKRFADKLAGN
jgi:hypothetical protein